mmetsp:Transcript_16326/g.39469  ORF Transcript_16326/g.39469 Transcript_16326/m.39469 type:complete len:355 (-) Transcript_16326:83-1147(-)
MLRVLCASCLGAVGQETCASVSPTPAVPGYYEAYATAHVQAEMLKDEQRMQAFRRAVEDNAELFRGKTVLDLGAGTGILSLICARAGAARVFAIEASAMAQFAQRIVVANGFADVIELLNVDADELEQLPGGLKVDIIISEWIGTFLFHESMLPSVLRARDKWLAPHGLLLPDGATLFSSTLEHVNHKEMELDFFQDVAGFNMSAMAAAWLPAAQQQCVFHKFLNSDVVVLKDINLYNATVADVSVWEVAWTSRVTRNDIVSGLVAWFDLQFHRFRGSGKLSTLKTSPTDPCTHWQQTVFYSARDVVVVTNETLRGRTRVDVDPSNGRNLRVQYEVAGLSSAINQTWYVTGAGC